jgi:anaerobic selenocysteine-containing dehydrogenase
MGSSAHMIRSSYRGGHGVCQVLVHMEADRVVKVTGDLDSPTSRGYLCPKGTAAPRSSTITTDSHVLCAGQGRAVRTSGYESRGAEAVSEMVERMDRIRRESRSEYFAMAQGTGRPYTEFTVRFANAFGTPNFVNPGHLCFLPRVIASTLTLGGLPISDIYGFGGITPACVMNWGGNHTETGAADGMCGTMFKRALKKAQKVIVVDPRRIGLVEKADHWLQLRPGSECALALALIHTIITEDFYDHAFVENYTFGFDRLTEHIRPHTPEWAEPITRVRAAGMHAAARTFASTKPSCL